MCGFVFALDYKKSNSIDIRAFSEMVDDLSHRGPDGEGFAIIESNKKESNFIDNLKHISNEDLREIQPFNMILGHRRLSIQDLSDNGKQPMFNEDKTKVIIFNGEIYNFPEIKTELIKKGASFKGASDTEVILKAYEAYGKECVKHFNGMWAFLIVDLITNEIFISRDRFGVKPLYYIDFDGIIYFSSEANVFKHIPNFDLVPNKESIKRYLNRGCHEWEKDTHFQNIYRFNIASNAVIKIDNFDGRFSQKRFWNLKTNTEEAKFCKVKALAYANDYYRILYDAVKIRLRSDVQVGSALSGGLDSSSIVYLVNEILKKENAESKQNTFSSVYTSSDVKFCDESFFIDLVTKSMDVNSHKITPLIEEIPAEHGKAIVAMENLFDGTAMSGWHTYKLTKSKGIKVTLDGQGADEVQAGYLHYFHQYFGTSPILKIPFRFMNAYKIPGSIPFILRGIILNIASRIVGRNFIEKMMLRTGRNFSFNLNQALADDTQTALVNLLYNSDRQSMAHSIESRLPFMDYRLIEFMNTVPSCYKIHNGWTKYIARLAFNGKLPDEVCWRRDKMGWPVPEIVWFSGDLKDWFSQTLLVSKNQAKEFVDIPEKGKYKKDENKKMMRILNLSRWLQIFIIKK